METVAFYSYKGGVGRSLLLANTARFLALSGQRVVALDLDFEAPGLHYKFDIERRVQTGAVELLLQGLKGAAPETIRDACVEVTLPVSQGGALLVLPAGPAPNIEYWESLSELQELLASRLGDGLLEAVLDLQMRIEEELAPDVLLVDARTGVTELGGFATTALSDRVVLVTAMNAESIDGIHAIAGALRRTPVLGDKLERKIHYVVARVHGTEPVDLSQWGELFEECFELPNDPIDGATERPMGSSIQMGRDWDESHRYRSDSLLAATLKWIQRAFPVNAKAAELSRRRLLAVDDAWRMLTQTSRRVGQWSTGRDAWDPKSLATSVQVKASDGSSRIADIVARLGAEKDKVAMVIEYVDDQPHEQVARWWFDNTRAAVVVLLSGDRGDRAVFSVRDRYRSHRLRPSERWDLPTPDDFNVLDDPADTSVSSLLKAVCKTNRFNERIVTEWVRYSASGLHGGAPWRPNQAKEILDSLSAIDNIDRAGSILFTCAHGSSFRNMWLGDGDDYLDQQVHEELCAPLCWRTIPEAFVRVSEGGGHFGPSPAFHAFSLLARVMGLGYDPDTTFRREGSRLVEKSANDRDVSLYRFTNLFKSRELSCEWSLSSPTISVEEDLPDPHGILSDKNPYHGYLGEYSPEKGLITIYAPSIDDVANRTGLPSRYVGSVTLIHLSVLALMHLGEDLDGRIWEGFSLGDPSPWIGGVPGPTLVLAQLFVRRFLTRLADDNLINAFEVLSEKQPPAYRSWKKTMHVSLESARAWLSAMRRGTGGAAPVDLDEILSAERS